MKRPFATQIAASSLAFSLVVSPCLPAWAAGRDKTPPVITHVKVLQAPKGQALRIRARIMDETEVFAPAVYVRPVGAKEYDSIEMRRVEDGFEAVIPAEQVTGPIEYFIEAFDEEGNGPAREGTPERPISVAVYDGASGGGGVVAVPPPPTDIPPPPPPTGDRKLVTTRPPPPADDEGGIATKWWFWTIIGAAVTGGIVVAVLATRSKSPVDFVDIEVRGPDPAGGLP